MSMSRDRVRFTLSVPVGSSSTGVEAASIQRAACEAFGVSRTLFPAGSSRVIVCRPSQFARFLILWNKYGAINSFKELEAELIPANTDVFDVSRHPNTVEV